MTPIYIHHITTSVPEHFYQQNFLRDKMKQHISNKRAIKSIIHRIYSNSGIEKRHAVVKDFNSNGHYPFFFQKDGSMATPSTGMRNAVYTTHARELFIQIAESLIREHPVIEKEDITHVITVSCTGFFAPGPAYEVVKHLGLSSSTQRFHLGFMGCFAAFPALKMAQAFCKAQPDSVVMIICLELCSIHFQTSEKTDNLISASVFADGGAGVLVSAQQPQGSSYRLEQFATSIAEKSRDDMAWTIGDTGFDMVLSTYVPDIIASNLQRAVRPLLETYNINHKHIDHWAVHPGGRSILDKIEKEFNLCSTKLESSRSILSNYGNMSSATILFVLKHLLERAHKQAEEKVVAMAFGPGLTIETGFFTKLNN